MAGLGKEIVGINRLGIFGGTFDPPHIGHLILASEAQYQLRLDRVLWVLTPEPPHKHERVITALDQRLDLLNAALAGDPLFEISRVDIDRSPPHFASDTVSLLHAQYPNAALVYLMGGDSLAELPDWHSPREFIECIDELGVMARPGWQPDLDAIEILIPSIMRRVRFIDAPLLQISSTKLRKAIESGAAYRYYLPIPVLDMIEMRGLYRKESENPH